MNKQQALEKLAALEAETKALRAIIEAPEPAGSLLPSVKEDTWCFMTDFHRKKLWFNDLEQRDDYMKVLETMFDLRRQPGSEVPKDDERQYTIEFDPHNDLCIEDFFTLRSKLARTSPCFATEEQAEAAIKTVGHERIRHMFNTLHGVK